MIETKETHDKIIKVLEEKGPSLPIQISKSIGISSLFTSAFLSELANEKRIKISHLKVGGSPLYFLEGQEKKLEDFYKYLHPKEAEAFLLLKKKKILKDSEQDPSIRVALRSIRDFSIGFKKEEEIYWRYMLTDEKEMQKQTKKTKSVKKQTKPFKEKTSTFQNPLILPTKKKKKGKQKSEFVLKITNILNNNFKIIEEKTYKAKEYNCIIQINSNLGPINFLTQAKDKKTISEADLKKLLSNAQKIPLPAFMIYTGKLSKKAEQFTKDYYSILKVKKIV
jgi:hypothetical protein